MAFDEAEMDMIRRGDMLGTKLGAKVATALETLQRERDEADNALVDRYLDPQTGAFSFPADVAAIVRRLDRAERDRDEAVEQELLAAQALESMQQNRDTLQRHFNECTIRAEAAERERDEAVSSAAAARANFHTMQNAANELRKERDEAREALKPFAQVLVYSFEDDPGKIHVTYAGETLTVLELDSDKGFAALKLEQDLAKARAALTKGE